MELIELIKKHGWRIFSDSDGSCPCGSAYIGGIKIKVHCWRTHLYQDDKKCNCEYAGVHIGTHEDVDEDYARKVGEEIKRDIETLYNCECKLVLKN